MNSQHKENSLDKTSTNKKTEEDLKKTSAYLDALGDALLVLDMEKKLIKFNTAALDLLGYTPEEISGISFEKLFHHKELDKHHTKMKDVLEDEETKSF